MNCHRQKPSPKLCFPVRMMPAIAALALGACLWACTQADRKPAGATEKATMAYPSMLEATLVQVAQSQGYFRQEGLDVSAHVHPYGKLALKELLEGKADFATVAETPVMLAIMNSEDISVIATISTSSIGHAILARKDKGIHTIVDLKGKKIATTLGTTAHFYQDMILAINEISPKDVQTVNLDVEAIHDVLTQGDIAAVSTFNPHIVVTQKKLGDRLITFQDKDVYTYTFNIVATREFTSKNPDKVRKLLHALLNSEKYVREHPLEAQKIMSAFSGVDSGLLSKIWDDYNFSVALDQQLILLLEDESRWAINSGLTNERQIPNYLNHIYFDGLRSVRPDAVRILR